MLKSHTHRKIRKTYQALYQTERALRGLINDNNLSDFERGRIWAAYEQVSSTSGKFYFHNRKEIDEKA